MGNASGGVAGGCGGVCGRSTAAGGSEAVMNSSANRGCCGDSASTSGFSGDFSGDLSTLASGDLTGVGDFTGVAGVAGADGGRAGDAGSVAGSSSSELEPSLSSSSGEPWAWDRWYLSPFACLYFFEQFGSGHSRRTGSGGGEDGVGGGRLAFGVGGRSSASEVRFLFESGLGGVKGVGEGSALLPFAPPFRSLLCTEDLVSVKLVISVGAAPRPRFARPLGVRASNSSVGESQNLWKYNITLFMIFNLTAIELGRLWKPMNINGIII